MVRKRSPRKDPPIPRITDSDLNKAAGLNIVFSQNVDCESCGATITDVTFDTGAVDEDGLCDVEQGDLVVSVECPSCGAEHEYEYSGWVNYGDA